MILIALLGAGVGVGVWVAARGLAPHPTPLSTLLAGLDTPGGATGAPSTLVGIGDRLGPRAARALTVAGVDLAGRHDDFRLVGRSPERHAVGKLAGALAGASFPLLAWVALAVIGTGLPAGVVLMTAAGLGVGGFVFPDFRLREAAERRRRAFRHALSGYLDLVTIILAGGGGLETALYTAADAGDGFAFALIRRALNRGRLTDRSPWDALEELGTDLGVAELNELAASVAIAGSHGARIRRSLAAKADTLRDHLIAETEAAAEAATERMTIPVAVLLSAYLFFIAYPAVKAITTTGAP